MERSENNKFYVLMYEEKSNEKQNYSMQLIMIIHYAAHLNSWMHHDHDYPFYRKHATQ